MATVERSRKAISIFKDIVSELRKANGHLKYLQDQFRDHQVTQRVHCKGPNETQHIARTYATYLNSTRELSELNEKYKGRERSVEESANLVGLTVPERRGD